MVQVTHDQHKLIRNHLVCTMLDCGRDYDVYSEALNDCGVKDIIDLVTMLPDYIDEMYMRSIVNGQLVKTPMVQEQMQMILDLIKWIQIKQKDFDAVLDIDEWISLDPKEFYTYINKPYPNTDKPKATFADVLPSLVVEVGTVVSKVQPHGEDELESTIKLEDSSKLEERVVVSVEQANNNLEFIATIAHPSTSIESTMVPTLVEPLVETELDESVNISDNLVDESVVPTEANDEESVMIDFYEYKEDFNDKSVFQYCWYYDSNMDTNTTYDGIEEAKVKAMTTPTPDSNAHTKNKMITRVSNVNSTYVNVYLPSSSVSLAILPIPAIAHLPNLLGHLLAWLWYTSASAPDPILWPTDATQPYKGVKYKYKHKENAAYILVFSNYTHQYSNYLAWGVIIYVKIHAFSLRNYFTRLYS